MLSKEQGMTAPRDLSAFLNILEANGELVRVSEQVHWDGEIAEIQRLGLAETAPAILFERISGHEDTWCRKLFVSGLATIGRMALALGLPKDAPTGEVIARLSKAFSSPIQPEVVAGGPVKKNTARGDEVDLHQFPAPKWHPEDGGRYLNTWCGVVTADPDTGEHNVGIYRGQVLSRNKIGVKLMPVKGWGKHYAKYRAQNRPMPVSVFYGGDPSLGFVGGCPIPRPTEYEIAGGMMGEPVRLVKCETNDLLVPADAEIVVEGEISPDPSDYLPEGPFGEWTGYYAPKKPAPVIVVECVTWKDDPILRGTLACTPPSIVRESATTGYLSQCAIIHHILESAGVEGVLDIETPPRRVPSVVIVKIQRKDQGHPRRVAEALWASDLTPKPVRAVLVVDGEADVRNVETLLNHFSMLNYFGKGLRIHFVPEGGEQEFSVEGKEALMYLGADSPFRVLVDATFDREADATAEERMEREMGPPCTGGFAEWADTVRKRWKDYGF